MNIAMLSHFLSIIIIFGTSLVCSSILTILLTLVVFSRFWLIIRWINSRLWLIIRWIMLSKILRTMNYVSFIDTISLLKYYIYANWWKKLLITVIVTMIPIYSSSTRDFLPWSIILLEWYDKLLNGISSLLFLLDIPKHIWFDILQRKKII